MSALHPNALSATTAVVLFDVDGTLAETERDGHRVAFNEAFAARGLDDVWDEVMYGDLLAVAGGRQRLEYYFRHHTAWSRGECAALAKELHADKTERFVEIVASRRIEPRRGVVEFIAGLQRAGVVTGIVTTGRRAWVEPLVEHLIGAPAYEQLSVIVTGDDVAELKPSPEAYLKAVSDLGVDRRSAIAIEDSLNGLESATSAGLATVVVPSRYHRGQDFSAADLVVSEFDLELTDGDATGSLLANPRFRSLLVDAAT